MFLQTVRNTRRRARKGQRGNTLVEVLIAATLFSVVFLSSMALMESGQRFSKSTLEIVGTEDLAQQMLFRIERMLASASPLSGTSTLSAALPAGSALATLASTEGFPPRGHLLVDPKATRSSSPTRASTPPTRSPDSRGPSSARSRRTTFRAPTPGGPASPSP